MPLYPADPLPVSQGGTGNTAGTALAVAETGGAETPVSIHQTGAPANPGVLIINDTTSSNITMYLKDAANFAYSGKLLVLELLNGSDTAIPLQIRNGGTGNSISIENDSGGVLTKIASTGVIFPVQAITASAPAYVKGGIYFDTTLSKLRVGGATAWETVTSV